MTLPTELTLKGKSPFKRTLTIHVVKGEHITAALYAPSRTGGITGPMLAWANGEVRDSRLRSSYGAYYCLWIGSAAFDVSRAEAEQIRANFALRFEETTPTLAPTAPTDAPLFRGSEEEMLDHSGYGPHAEVV